MKKVSTPLHKHHAMKANVQEASSFTRFATNGH
jgi:hypothetical protein